MTARAPRTPAAHRPVASVLPMLGLAHLDRPFDYQVDSDQAEDAVPGARVRVRFSGRLVDGFVLDRLSHSDHPGRLGFIDRVVSPEAVLTPEVATLCRAVADRYAGTMSDVLRLAIPPRHGRTEQAVRTTPTPTAAPGPPDPTGWDRYRNGTSFTGVVGAGGPARAAWQALPGEQWAVRLAELATHAVRSGRGVIVVVPDKRDLDRVEAACRAVLGDTVVALSAGLGPAARYRRWLRVLRGTAGVVVGTRSAAFAPVADLGLLVVWDDGDDSLTEPRAPYPHPREVAVLRAAESGCALVIGGLSRTAETQTLVDSGWMHDLVAERSTVRARAPRVLAISDEDRRVARDPMARVARIPEIAFDAARSALAAQTPVLISVPRRGYHPSVACGRCRTRVRCRRCHGPVSTDGPVVPPDARAETTCRWCGDHESSFRCVECGDTRLRALTSGARRTAEELGKAFSGVPVVTSGGDHMVDDVGEGARVVVATPGAEPVARGGYGAAVLLDTWAQLDRPDLRAGEQTLRRWLAVISLVRPADEKGSAVIVADAGLAVVQAAIRFDPAGFAAEEVRTRAELGLPPAVTMVSVDGPAAAITEFAAAVALPPSGETLGPVELPVDARRPAGSDATTDGGIERILLRVNRSDGRALVHSLREAQVLRNAHHDVGPLRVQVDPPTIG